MLAHFSLLGALFRSWSPLARLLGVFGSCGSILEGFWEGFGKPKPSKNKEFSLYFASFEFGANFLGNLLCLLKPEPLKIMVFP